MATRGQHLVRGDRGFVTGAGIVGKLAGPAFERVLDRIDGRLRHGGIHVTLPGGSERRIGFHAPGPHAEVRIVSWRALVRLVTSGSVGWYKAWASGEWTSPDPVPLFELFSRNAVALGQVGRAKGPSRWVNLLAHRLRDNVPRQARSNIAAHYDLGNDFYSAWLDRTMTYSCAKFSPPCEGGEELRSSSGVGRPVKTHPRPLPSREGSLEDAQLRKIGLLLDRLNLQPGQRLLEIGCGWGTLAMEAAKRGASVVGLTLSTEQKAWAERAIAKAGLADRVEIRLQDYRETDEQFDAIASVEMVEAVGQRWWGAYLDSIRRNLTPGGRAALQFISIDHNLFDRYARNADFIQTYIFPGGLLVDTPRFRSLAADRGLSWQDHQPFGQDYAETLKRWRARYDATVANGDLPGFDQPFHDLWRYYLMYCEGGFRGGAIDVAQVTMVKA